MAMVNSYLLEGQVALAVEWAAKLKEEEYRLSAAAAIEHALGHPQKANAALEALIAKVGSPPGPRMVAGSSAASYLFARHYAWRGELDHAFEWLDKAYVLHDSGLHRLKIDSWLKPLRGDPRYKALLKKMNLPLD